MSQRRARVTIVRTIFAPVLKGWLEWVRHRQYAYHLPFRCRQSRLVHDLISSIATMRNIPEVSADRLLLSI